MAIDDSLLSWDKYVHNREYDTCHRYWNYYPVTPIILSSSHYSTVEVWAPVDLVISVAEVWLFLDTQTTVMIIFKMYGRIKHAKPRMNIYSVTGFVIFYYFHDTAHIIEHIEAGKMRFL